MSDNTIKIEQYWQSRWWEKPAIRSHLKASDIEISNAISLLRQEFDQAWFDSISCPAEHSVSQNLMLGEGTTNIRSLLDTARQIQVLRGVHGFSRVLREFKKEKSWMSANIEMLMGYVFKDEGMPVEFIVPKSRKGPTPDILVHSPSGPFAIECKRLEEARGEQWIERFQMAYFCAFSDADFGKLHPYVFPHVPYLPLKGIGFPNNPPNPESYARYIAAPIISQLRSMRTKGQIDSVLRTDTHDIALFTEPYHEFASISAPDPEPRFLMRRLMGNISRATGQIRAYAETHGLPGVLVVWQAAPCDYDYLNARLLKVMATPEYKNIIGIMVMKMGNLLSYQRPLWVRSPLSAYDDVSKHIEFVISKRFYPAMISQESFG